MLARFGRVDAAESRDDHCIADREVTGGGAVDADRA
jgi:hypothetical protein